VGRRHGDASRRLGGMGNEDRVFAKCAWRLIPFMGLLFLANFVDRTNVGFAALTMNKDLGFSPTVFGFGAGIFFFSYALCQVPANLVLERLGVRRWIFCILAVWGIVSASNALRDPRVLALAVANFAIQSAAYGVALWLPQIVQGMGFSNSATGFIVSLCFVAGVPSMILGGRSSSR
jgi:ACS family tartrate transporter-like MFS transporter